jgi:Arf-GAP/coiled-coil/ANK repeat/PH domain-containing protein
MNIFLQGSVMAVEFLLLNGAKINAQDADGKTPLHLATELSNNLLLLLLLFYICFHKEYFLFCFI